MLGLRLGLEAVFSILEELGCEPVVDEGTSFLVCRADLEATPVRLTAHLSMMTSLLRVHRERSLTVRQVVGPDGTTQHDGPQPRAHLTLARAPTITV